MINLIKKMMIDIPTGATVDGGGAGRSTPGGRWSPAGAAVGTDGRTDRPKLCGRKYFVFLLSINDLFSRIGL